MTTAGDPTGTPPDEQAFHEHAKRERAWTPAARWQAIQETIRWAEAQANARRNTPAACIERERAHGVRQAATGADGAAHRAVAPSVA